MHRTKYLVIFFLMFLHCFNQKTIETSKDMVEIDTLEIHKSLEVVTEPSISDPVVSVKATQYGSGNKLHKHTTFFKYQPTTIGWISVLIPSALAGVFGYTKISKGEVVLGRDLIGLSALPPLLTFGFSLFTFKKSKTFKEPFNFSDSYNKDMINASINEIAYSKSFQPSTSGYLSLDISNYMQLFPSNSDIHFTFSLPDKSVDPCVITINNNFLVQLKVQLKREAEANNLLAKGDEYYDNKNYSEAYSIYRKIKEQYSDTKAMSDIEDRLANTKKQIELAEKTRIFEEMKNKNLEFLSRYGFNDYSIALLTSTLNKLKDDVRIVVITEGLKIPARDASEAWSAYNKLSVCQKLYAVLVTAELAVGTEPLYKKQLLKDWLIWSDLAEKLSYIKSSQLK